MKKYKLDDKDQGKWNSNIHYHKVILQNLPQKKESALDIGCGEGILTRQLAKEFNEVKGIDLDFPSIDKAKKLTPFLNVNYEVLDFMKLEMTGEKFDMIASVASLHHMESEEALISMKKLLKPGGIIAIVGIANPNHFSDLPQLAISFLVNNMYWIIGKKYKHQAPIVWPPPLSNKQTKEVAEKILPGCRFKKHWLNRFTIIWKKPVAPS